MARQLSEQPAAMYYCRRGHYGREPWVKQMFVEWGMESTLRPRGRPRMTLENTKKVLAPFFLIIGSNYERICAMSSIELFAFLGIGAGASLGIWLGHDYGIAWATIGGVSGAVAGYFVGIGLALILLLFASADIKFRQFLLKWLKKNNASK